MNAKIRADFPEVRRTTTGELAAALAGTIKQVLLDVRTKRNSTSVISKAPSGWSRALVRPRFFPKDKSIVTYCSVGYRSAAFAKRLSQAGYRNGTNLEGSIFRWANENRPLVRDGGPTDKVHPYNRLWGLLLDKSHRAVVPEK